MISVINEFHKMTLSGGIECHSADFIDHFTFLALAQEFEFVTPDSFSLCERGGVWARDYLAQQETLSDVSAKVYCKAALRTAARR